jgi:hypothetical protein
LANKSDEEVAQEIYQSVIQSNTGVKRLKSSTFWFLFDVKAKKKTVIERIEQLLEKNNLEAIVKSGKTFGEEDKDDWIMLSPIVIDNLPGKLTGPKDPSPPSPDWFKEIQTRTFESEREVETYFIVPIIEKLGYYYEDIVIGHPVNMFKGVKRIKTEADFVVFKGPGRELEDVLLVIEAKNSDKDISWDHIGQAKSYAHELLPACYIITNGEKIKVFRFSGSLFPDKLLMDFERSMLVEKWDDFYGYASKNATVQRKLHLINLMKEISDDDNDPPKL